jgi:membrane peptidoglycan carboxypeptidase
MHIWGEKIYGIKNACEHYYHKDIRNITNEELVSLIMLSYNPIRYKMGSEENKNKTLKY